MSKKNLFVILILLLLIHGCVVKPPMTSQPGIATGTIVYVSTEGNDGWSGMIPDPNVARTDGPFATLKRARNALRKFKKLTGAMAGYTVLVRGGIYRLDETFALGPEDSGTESHPAVFKAYQNEHPILTGTRLITNFAPYAKCILKADLRGVPLKSNRIHQLFADGKRQTLARFPNYDPSDPIGGGFLYVQNHVAEGSKSQFKYADNATIRHWEIPHRGEIFIYPGPNYWNNIIPIAGIDYAKQIITLANNASYAIKQGNRYFFQNILEELDAPGEWYFDQGTKALYFWPVDNASLRNVNTPILKSIIEIKGNTKREAPAFIRIEGFTIEGCDGTAMVVSGTNNTVIARNTISNAGNNGIEVHDGTQNTVIGNDVYQVGGSGIIMSGGNRKTLDHAQNRSENNYVHHIGIFSKDASGIACSGVGNIITHNLVHSTPRAGISFDGNDHLIEYNHVHHVNQETQDSAIIYSCARDWTKRGTLIRYNYLHDSGGYGRNSIRDKWQNPFYTWGIGLDDWTSGTIMYGNIIAHTYYGGIGLGGGSDNIIENNIIAEALKEQVRFQARSANDPMIFDMFAKVKEMGHAKYPQLSLIQKAEMGAIMSGNQFLYNIIYFTGANSTLYDISETIDASKMIFDNNTFFNAGKQPKISYIKAPSDQQWLIWKARGFDAHSIVTDPLFKDIAGGNYELLPNSPAIRQGFRPIQLNKIGLYNDPLRASWPMGNNSEFSVPSRSMKDRTMMYPSSETLSILN